MVNALANWIDERTGLRKLTAGLFDVPVPGGASWAYVFGAALTVAFLIQLLTGVLLMFTYSPSTSTAWGSVYFVEEHLTLGWFVRGLHHYGSQAVVVLLGLHLIQMVLTGAYRSPRELTWWLGLALIGLTVGMCVTGWMLPWDQKGYWAAKVPINIAASAAGPEIQKLIVGGVEVGNLTLTRFYALHVSVLPALIALTLITRTLLFRKQGYPAPAEANRPDRYWPDQLFHDAVASFLVLSILALLTFYHGGAPLMAPADPSDGDYPARPEWYFLFLFQLLKYFPAELEIIGTVVIPVGVAMLLASFPFFSKIMPNRLAHFLACGILFALTGGATYLMIEAIVEDAGKPELALAHEDAEAHADRALALANSPAHGIPPEGAGYLLSNDPLTRGGDLFARKCLACHAMGDQVLEKQVASNLQGYGTYAWIKGLLVDPDSDFYFGLVPSCQGMSTWKRETELNEKNLMKRDEDGDGLLSEQELTERLIVRLDEFDADGDGSLNAEEIHVAVDRQISEVADFVASFSEIPADMTPLEWVEQPQVYEHPALDLFMSDCGSCHQVDEIAEGGFEAPSLYAYGTPQWIERMIRKPQAGNLYGYLYDLGEEGLMPPYEDQLTQHDLDMIIRYMRGAYLDGPAIEQRPHFEPEQSSDEFLDEFGDVSEEFEGRGVQVAGNDEASAGT